MKHYFMTLPDVVFPENRFCAKCGEYFTHTNHLHGRDCQCKTCQQERLLTKRAADECPHCHAKPAYTDQQTYPTVDSDMLPSR